ncbi:Ferroporti-1 [Linnemannia elongata]|nr:Ferroporti-1 [Linnemannia elongata]
MSQMNDRRKLYLSHLLTSWVDRSFEFASYLLISRVYTQSLLQASVYGLSTTLAALFLSNRIGNWINILSRLNTYRITLFIQKASIVISAILFHYLDSSEGAQNVLYAFVIVLGCTLKLSFIGNSIAIEKDWAMIISDGHLEQLLPTMRRIDLVCKTLSPIFIGYLLSASSLVITLVICAWTAVSTIAEYILVSQLYSNVPGLSVRSPHNSTSLATGEEEASVPISIREYVQHRTFLATLALGMLYMNVLSFGGTMTAYLVLIGYNSGLLGIMKAVAGIMGVAGTYVMPLLAKRLGNIRTGLWSIWQLALTLALVVVALTNRLDYMATSILLFGGMAASRLGLWMFDIAENLILQEYTAPIHITSITGWQYSLCNLFDLLQYVLTIIVSDPAQFIIPASISAGSIVGAAIIYTWFVWKDRGHLLHPLKLK